MPKPSTEECRDTVVVLPAEAREILRRFCASHFRTPGEERARTTIPANYARDDDLRMSVFIDRTEILLAAARGVVEAAKLTTAGADTLPLPLAAVTEMVMAVGGFEED